MKNFHVFPVFLSTIFLLALQSEKSLAQSQCCGRIFGIPICTGFCIDLDTSSVHKKINKLEKSADSLAKEAERLKDSLVGKISHKDFGDLFLDADSLIGSLPDNLKKWEAIPKEYHFEVPDLPEYRYKRIPRGQIDPFALPKENKKQSPIYGFKGWYFEKLADIGK